MPGINASLLCAVIALVTSSVPPSASAPTGILVLHNTRWDRVQVDVRVGASQDCEQNSAQGARVLKRDESWAVVSSEIVCWRREAQPGAEPLAWTPWQARRGPSMGVDDVAL